jgi:SP family sugar porter-like MFS transporter
MGRESIEEGQLSSPLLPKEKHEAYAGVSVGGGGGEQSRPSSATAAVVLTTLVAVSGSYVFGSAVSFLTLELGVL